jgi:hypothetical protein
VSKRKRKRTSPTARWAYEAEEAPKRKHAWSNSCPGFVKHRGALVGKCPHDLTTEEAERLLNTGLPYPSERWGKDWPDRIYVVHEGAVYRAVPTVAGRSYHGFPELPSELRRLPRTFRESLLSKARELGCEDQVRRWMRKGP